MTQGVLGTVFISLVLVMCVFAVRGCYVTGKQDAAKALATGMLSTYSGHLVSAREAAKDIQRISVERERVSAQQRIDAAEARGKPIVAEILAVLQDPRADLRAAFEDGYNQDPSYVRPQVRLEEVASVLAGLEREFRQRRTVRDSILRFEYTLRCRLKHPRADEGVELPASLAEVAAFPELLRLIPPASARLKLESLGDPKLVNHLGMCLLWAQPVVADLERIGRERRVLDRARSLYAIAQANYARVEDLNDALPHWYDPAKDDGVFDEKAYNDYRLAQQPAVDAMAAGDAALDQLRTYQGMVRSQVIEWVSGQPTQSTSYSHSRRVRAGKDKDGNQRYRTEHYSTAGMIFFVERSTNTGAGVSTTRTKVGEKDSDDDLLGSWGGSWARWSYKPDEQIGYLIQYKGFGLDPASTIRGGTFQPAEHRILDPNQVPVDAINAGMNVEHR